MNKNEIYKYIGYNGKYTKEVKSKLRKLLKKYHPDHKNGDVETFKLINAIKKELESNKNIENKYVDIKESSNSKVSREELEYYQEKIKKLNKEKNNLSAKIKEKNNIISDLKKNYSNIYDDYFDNKEYVIEKQNQIHKLTNLKKHYILYIIPFILIMIFQKYFLLILLAIILVIDFIMFKNILNKNNLINNDYLLKDQDLGLKKEEQEKKIDVLKKDIIILERKLNTINNDIRFYNNIIKNQK